MSSVYLYGVLDRPAEGARGIEGEPIESIPAGGVWLAIGHLERPPDPGFASLRAHDRAVRRLHAMVTALLPARFGQSLGEVSTLEQRFAAEGSRLRAALDRVAGCVQMTLRVEGLTPASPRPESPRPGTDYLRLRKKQASGEGFDPRLDELLAACAGSCRGTRVRWNGELGRLGIFHLVPAADLASYEAAIEAHRGALPGLRVSGPWPPYAFADE